MFIGQMIRQFYGAFLLFIIIRNSNVECSLFLLLQEGYNLKCVTNSSSALALIFPIAHRRNYYYNTPVTGYVPTHFAHEFRCLYHRTCDKFFPWQIKNSLDDVHSDYILDRRWEGFSIMSASRHSSLKPITQENFSIPISILAGSQTNILLCNYASCYWLIMQRSDGTNVIKKCKYNEEPSEVQANSDCQNELYTIKVDNFIFNGSWEHFKIIKNGNTLQLFQKRINEMPLIEYTDNEGLMAINYIEVNGYDAWWKIHKVNYYSITTEETTTFGPNFVVKDKFLCISVLVKMCSNCQIELGFEGAPDKKKQTFATAVENWQEIKYIIDDYQYNTFRLKVKTFITVEQSDKYWYIESLRMCQKNEYRVLSYNSNRDEASTIKCQLISDQEHIIGSAPPEPAIPNTCPFDVRYETIGSVCFSCGLVNIPNCYHTKFCENNKGNLVCSCSVGYSGVDCMNATGILLFEPPTVVEASYTSCTIEVNGNNVYSGSTRDFSYEIQYKALENSDWEIYSAELFLYKTKSVIYDLLPNTTYLFRYIGVGKSSMLNNNELIETSKCTTLCKALDNYNIEIIPTNISATIYLKLDLDNCKIDDCIITVPGKQAERIDYTTYKLMNLMPYRSYTLLISHCGNVSSLKTKFQTFTGKANIVRGLQIYFQNKTVLGVRWRDPYPQTGRIKDFVFSVNGTTQFIGLQRTCKFWTKYYCWEIQHLDNEKEFYNIEVAAQNYNFFQTGDIAVTTSKGLPKKTSEVYNLNYVWTTDNQLTLFWNHPNYTYGNQITFYIHIKAQNLTNPLKEHHNATSIIHESLARRAYQYKLTYFYNVKSTLAPSSLYEIQILTSEQFERMTPKLLIFSPPPIPQLAEAAEVQYLNNSLLLSFSVKKEIYPLDNTTYKILIASELIPPNTPSLSNNLKLLYENKSQEHNVLIIATDFYNIPINQNNQYTVVIILINEYKNQSRSKMYYNNVGRESVTEEATGWLPFLALLLLIPFIILLIMKRRIVANKFMYLQQKCSRILHLDPVDDNKELIALSTNPKLSIENTQKKKSKIVAPENKMEEIYSRPVKIIDFEQYVKECVINQEFQQQYGLFSSESPIYEELDLCDRRTDHNNYDHTRVVLERHHKNEYSNCINANYIDGYKVPKAYIATDCPQPNTLYDFWWMIWEENTEYIIMLANIYESGKRKIEKYWPEKNKTLTVQDIVIAYTCNKIYADYEKREFSVVKNGEVRKVKQLYFCSWPDDGVPLYSQSLVPFLKEILKIPLYIDTPIVIHCSVDDGIIGTVLLCDICLRMAAREGIIDVLCHLQELRRQRANLVDNIEQYKLAHLVMLECLLGFHTNISCKELEKNVADLLSTNKIKHQMGYLIDTAWHDQAMKKSDVENDQLPPNYHAKNRLKHVIPEYHGRISLSPILNNEQSSYINAVKVDGYRIPGRYIVTQQPMSNTLGDFWRMITEQDVSVIISLNEINLKHETSCQFWPTENGFNMNPVNYITLKFLNNTDFNYYNLTTIQMSITKKNQRKIKNIDIIWLRQWYPKKLVPNSVEEFITFWEEANTLCRMAKNVSVTCYDGVTASGIYVAISFLIEKMKLEQTCDVCQAVRTIRRNRKEFISSEVQFKFLYEVAVNYIQGFHSYANFN